MPRSQSGFVHVLLIILLLVGIVVGVYLVSHPQIFKSRANNPPIVFAGPNVITQNGQSAIKPILKNDGTIDHYEAVIQLTAPNIAVGFSPVKTVHAQSTLNISGSAACLNDKPVVNLNWPYIDPNDVYSLNVYRNPPAQNINDQPFAGSSGYTDNNVQNGVTYSYSVIGGSDNGGFVSNTVTVTTPNCAPTCSTVPLATYVRPSGDVLAVSQPNQISWVYNVNAKAYVVRVFNNSAKQWAGNCSVTNLLDGCQTVSISSCSNPYCTLPFNFSPGSTYTIGVSAINNCNQVGDAAVVTTNIIPAPTTCSPECPDDKVCNAGSCVTPTCLGSVPTCKATSFTNHQCSYVNAPNGYYCNGGACCNGVCTPDGCGTPAPTDFRATCSYNSALGKIVATVAFTDPNPTYPNYKLIFYSNTAGTPAIDQIEPVPGGLINGIKLMSATSNYSNFYTNTGYSVSLFLPGSNSEITKQDFICTGAPPAPSPTAAPKATKFYLAENPLDLDPANLPYVAHGNYRGDPTVLGYIFSTHTPGPRTLFVKFIYDNGGSLTRQATVQLLEPPSSQGAVHNPKVLAIGFNPVENGQNVAETYFSYDMGNRSADQFEDYLFGTTISAFKQFSNNLINYQIAQKIHVTSFPNYSNNYQYTLDKYKYCVFGRPDFNPTQCKLQKQLFDHAAWFRDNRICETADNLGVDEIWIVSPPYLMAWESFMVGPSAGFWVNGPYYVVPECRKHYIVMDPSYERSDPFLHIYGHRIESIMGYLSSFWTSQDAQRYWYDFYNTKGAGQPNYPGDCGNAHFAINSQHEYDYSSTQQASFGCSDLKNFPTLQGTRQNFDCSKWGCNEIGWQQLWFSALPNLDGEIQIPTKNGASVPFKKDWWHYLLYPENALAFGQSVNSIGVGSGIAPPELSPIKPTPYPSVHSHYLSPQTNTQPPAIAPAPPPNPISSPSITPSISPVISPPSTSRPGSTITIYAAGQKGGGALPNMQVYIKDFTKPHKVFKKVGGNPFTPIWVIYTITYPSKVTPSQVRVRFTNDFYNPTTHDDRNLRVSKINIDGVNYPSSASNVYSTGTWNSATGCKPGNKQSEWLHCNGYFQYGQ